MYPENAASALTIFSIKLSFWFKLKKDISRDKNYMSQLLRDITEEYRKHMRLIRYIERR